MNRAIWFGLRSLVGVDKMKAAQQIGGLYAKIGQMTKINTPDEDIFDNCLPLHDNMVRERYQEYLKDSNLQDIGGMIGSGSVAAVFLSSGDIAIKIRYPGLKQSISRDTWLLEKIGSVIGLGSFPQQVQESMYNEINFAKEVETIRSFSLVWNCSENIRIPKVYQELCREDVVAMEYFPQASLWESIRTASQCQKNFIGELILEFCLQSNKNGFIFADPHWGNFKVGKDLKTLFVIDFGCVGVATSSETNAKARNISKQEFIDCFLKTEEVSLEQAEYHYHINKIINDVLLVDQPYTFNQQFIKSFSDAFGKCRPVKTETGSFMYIKMIFYVFSMLSQMECTVNAGRIQSNTYKTNK